MATYPLGGYNGHPFLWTPQGGLVDLLPPGSYNSGEAVGVNSAGQVVGFLGGQGGGGFTWSSQAGMHFISLPNPLFPPENTPTAMNEAGIVCGHQWVTPGSVVAWTYDSATGRIDELPGLGGNTSLAHAINGSGDIVGLTPSGTIDYRPGNGKGTFGPGQYAGGWPSSVTLVPFGDLDGDRQSDILVRFSSGELRAYRTSRGQAFVTGTSRTSLGTGWNQYNLLTYPGDITSDGRPDLIARKASTGEVFLYKGTSGNRLTARVRIAANWSGYKKIVGVGDLNGDGRGDLLAQDASNTLWRYDGTGTGGFGARVKVATNWGSNYNAVIGIGDITGDARADIVSRDTAGNVWRNSGNGKGSFGPRTRIATGWQAYKSLY
jgi:hypothetical protein